MEKLIRRHDKLIELGLTKFALFVLSILFFRRDLSIKDASVEDLEGDVEDDQDCQQHDCSVEEERHAEKSSPDNQGNDRKELNEGNYYDDTCDRILCADVRRSQLLLFAFAKAGDHAADEGCHQEWERYNTKVVDCEQLARCAILVFFPASWTSTLAFIVVYVKPRRTSFTDTRVI